MTPEAISSMWPRRVIASGSSRLSAPAQWEQEGLSHDNHMSCMIEKQEKRFSQIWWWNIHRAFFMAFPEHRKINANVRCEWPSFLTKYVWVPGQHGPVQRFLKLNPTLVLCIIRFDAHCPAKDHTDEICISMSLFHGIHHDRWFKFKTRQQRMMQNR